MNKIVETLSKKQLILLPLAIMIGIWIVIIIASNLNDRPIAYPPASEDNLNIPFNSEQSLKLCVFSTDDLERTLGAVILVNTEEFILPLQLSSKLYTGTTSKYFDDAMSYIENIKEAKELTRTLIDKSSELISSDSLINPKDVTIHPFIDTPPKFIHGANSRKHHRNAKRLTVKGWMPGIATLFLNPYNFLTGGDSFYSEVNEEQEFGFFHGNPLNHYSNGDTVALRYKGQKLDVEAELAVVIAKKMALI